ncbi:hypothetical protein [Nocardia sp. alder85J]|uniref:hypothetical protein n=1 Tax=Nocardia sp. alder85J TaxID=2862949 RepID=UPI001CD4BB53|nr:hypothetical protein [Nocardia sp. alder85J]MCX4098241.1 hypothetical protein [Nocardia sp. alder85J]
MTPSGPRCALLLVALIGALSAAPGAAHADSAGAGGDIAVAQTLGDRELTVTLRRVTSVPGPLRVDIVTHAGVAAGRLRLAVTPTGAATTAISPAPGVATAHTTIDLGGTPGMVSATVPVDRAGPWELAVDDGARVARIPFLVPAQVTSPPERLVYWGFLAAGVLLPVTVLVAVRARRTGWALLPGAGTVAGVSVAITAAVLSATLPLPPQPGLHLDPGVDNVTHPYASARPQIADYSRPPVLLTVTAAPTAAGTPTDLGLALVDAATGTPVDDLVVHDEALIHLLIAGPRGELWHLHPIRTAPGRYEVPLTPPGPGRYAVSAELERRGGGIHLVRAATGLLIPSATPSEPVAPVPILSGTTRAATAGPATLAVTAATAGTPITVTATFGDTPDLQPWLGMVGHMIVAGPLPADADLGTAVQQAPIWGHAHSMGGPVAMPGMNHSNLAVPQVVPAPTPSTAAHPGDEPMGPMPGMLPPSGTSTPGSGGDRVGPMPGATGTPGGSTPGTTGDSAPGMADMGTGNAMLMPPVNGESGPDETVAAYGPGVPFTFVFPLPGRYRVWIQVERNYAVLTVPFVIDVAGPGGQP